MSTRLSIFQQEHLVHQIPGGAGIDLPLLAKAHIPAGLRIVGQLHRQTGRLPGILRGPGHAVGGIESGVVLLSREW